MSKILLILLLLPFGLFGQGNFFWSHTFISETSISIENTTYTNNYLQLENADLNGISFANNGKSLYYLKNMSHPTPDTLVKYSSSISYDLSDMEEEYRVGLTQIIGSVRGLEVTDDESDVFILNVSPDSIYKFNMSVNGNLSTLNYTGNSFKPPYGIADQSFGFDFNNDYTKLYFVRSGNVTQFSLNPKDLSSATYDNIQITISSMPSGDVLFSSSGKQMLILNSQSDSFVQYELSTAWDISTAVSAFSYSFTEDDGMRYFDFGGNKLFSIGISNDRVYEYTLEEY